MSKKSIIVGLAGVNLLLLAALLATVTWLPTAQAQPAGGPGGGHLTITARVEPDVDALFLLDLTAERLHGFVPERQQTGQLHYLGFRDLKRDFGPG